MVATNIFFDFRMSCYVKDIRIFDWPDSDETITGVLRKGINNPGILPKPFKRGIPLKKEFVVKDHQYDVLKWSLERRGGIISAQMGMGKTFMGICIPALDQKYPMPALIVCPLSLIDNWVTDGFKKFFGDYYKVFVYHSSYNKLEKISYLDLCSYDYVITTSDTLRKSESISGRSKKLINKDLFSSNLIYSGPQRGHLKLDYEGEGLLHYGAWSHVIFDESHEYSNKATGKFKSAYGLYALKYWALTGTAERNSAYDLWTQLMICHIPSGKQSGSKYEMSEVVRTYDTPDHVYKIDYQKANIKLPPLNRQNIIINYDREQRDLYLDILGSLRDTLRRFEEGEDRFSSVLALFTQLRLCSISPKLIDLEKGAGKKIEKIVELVKEITEKGEKVVINSAFVKGLDLIEEELLKENIKCTKMTGETPAKKRQSYIDEFRDKTSVFLTSYKVGGIGINLQFANNWISLEPWWNESVHRQGLQRIWRPGQTRACNAYFVLGRGIESAIMKMAEEKQYLIELENKVFTKVALDKEMIRAMIAWKEGDFSGLPPQKSPGKYPVKKTTKTSKKKIARYPPVKKYPAVKSTEPKRSKKL